ncbi:MAG: hypothetical protein JW866_02285 [Ignavibacteriales bacterium]|nr:hypothetical protein [Ignavibacteriales bacterium]
MKATKLEYFPHELILKTPFRNSKCEISKKKIYYIELTFEDGEKYLGESSLSPELGTENEKEFLKSIKKLKSAIDKEPIDINREIRNFKEYTNCPALLFGISQCVFNKKFNDERNDYLDNFFAKQIGVNAVIDLSPIDECVSAAKEYANEGFETIKIKIGRKDFNKDYELIKQVREAIGNNINLRVDVNENWDYSVVVSRLEKLKKFNIQFVEQPVEDLNKMKSLAKMNLVPIALDKSLGTKFLNLDLAKEPLDFFVIKPMLYGNVIRTFNKICLDELKRIKIIISSSFESCVARSMLVFLAAAVDNDLCHGLNAGEFISNELYDDPFKVKNGKINFDVKNYPPKFKELQ